MSTATMKDFTRSSELPDDVRAAVRDMILVLADTKRLLGMRYGQWILGAPELEAGIACASMAQDEWGHARLLYALLKDFGEDIERLEHGREAGEYYSMEALDSEPRSWMELVAINALADTALTVQLESLATSAYVPLRQRVQKLTEEEAFHGAHGVAWFRRIAGAGDTGRTGMADAVDAILPAVLRWFGRDNESLSATGIAAASGDALREWFLERVGHLLELAGVTAGAPDFTGFDDARRRVAGTAPDDRTIAQVRGDLNRAFLMD